MPGSHGSISERVETSRTNPSSPSRLPPPMYSQTLLLWGVYYSRRGNRCGPACVLRYMRLYFLIGIVCLCVRLSCSTQYSSSRVAFCRESQGQTVQSRGGNKKFFEGTKEPGVICNVLNFKHKHRNTSAPPLFI